MNWHNVKYQHVEGCTCKGVVKENVVREEGEIVEYDAYCPSCKKYLYTFSFGHYTIKC